MKIDEAFFLWRQSYSKTEADDAVAAFLGCDVKTGWLRRSREALLLSADTVATRLGVSKAAYLKLEKNEESRAITLASLANAAEAIDCELVYAIRPKSMQSFSRMIWQKLLPEVLLHSQVRSNPNPMALSGIARWKLRDPKTRRKFGWVQR